MSNQQKQQPGKESQPVFAPPDLPATDKGGLPGELMSESRSGPGGEGIREEADAEKEFGKDKT